MNSATNILRKEHDAILRVLELTEEAARKLDCGEAVPADTLGGLLRFFRIFADQCHHGKEEELLFPLLEQKGMPRAGGPIAVMLHEHESGRRLIREMAESEQQIRGGNRQAASRWAQAARGS